MPDEQERVLTWNAAFQRWEYVDRTFLLWMTDKTLKAYVTAWLVVQYVEKPTRRQEDAALARCLRVAHYDYILDPEVHVLHSARPRI